MLLGGISPLGAFCYIKPLQQRKVQQENCQCISTADSVLLHSWSQAANDDLMKGSSNNTLLVLSAELECSFVLFLLQMMKAFLQDSLNQISRKTVLQRCQRFDKIQLWWNLTTHSLESTFRSGCYFPEITHSGVHLFPCVIIFTTHLSCQRQPCYFMKIKLRDRCSNLSIVLKICCSSSNHLLEQNGQGVKGRV